MNEYLVELYGWIQSKDNTFNQRYKYQDFEDNMQDLKYATDMYEWIASTDDTFTAREPIAVWTEKIKKKKDLGTAVEEMSDTEVSIPISDGSQPIDLNIQADIPVPEDLQQYNLLSSREFDENSNLNLNFDSYDDYIADARQQLKDGTLQTHSTTYSINGNQLKDEPMFRDDDLYEGNPMSLGETGQGTAKEQYDRYVKDINTVQEETNNPFNTSLKVVTEDLIDKEEEFAVPLMNYHFNQYGIEAEEADFFGDGMRLKAKNGAEIYINLDRMWSHKKTRDKLKRFLKDNYLESRRIYNEEFGYQQLQRKIIDDNKIDASIQILNTDANLFNNNVQSWLKLNAEVQTLDGIYGNLTQEQINQLGTLGEYNQYLKKKKKVRDLKEMLLKTDAELQAQGAKVDQVMGDYYAMKSMQGELSGGFLNGLFDGVGRKTAGLANNLTDFMVGYMGSESSNANTILPNIAFSDRSYQNAMAGMGEKMFGVEFPEQMDTEEMVLGKKKTVPAIVDYEEWKKNFTEEQLSDMDSAVRDNFKKEFKYSNIYYDSKGRQKNKVASAGSNYSTEAADEFKNRPENEGFLNLQRRAVSELLGTESSTVEYNKFKKQEFWGGALFGLAESIPAMLGNSSAAGWALRTSNMYLQVSDHLNQEMADNPNFANISENEKQAFMLPVGAVVATLEAVGLRNVLQQKGVLNAVLLRSIGKFKTLKGVQKRNFTEVVQNEVENMIARGVLVVGAAGMAEFETGFAQEIADLSGKYIYNELIKEKDMFVLPETATDVVKQVLRAGAQEMIGGFIMGVPGAISVAASSKNFSQLDNGVFEVFENMINDDKNDGKSSRIYTLWLKDQVNQGLMTLKEAKSQESIFNEIKGVYSQIPNDYTTDQKKKALGLLLSKQRLEQQIAGKDKNSVSKQLEQIEEINRDLENINTRAYIDNQRASGVRVEEDDAKKALLEEGVENPTQEQIKNKQNELQKRKTEELAEDKSSSDLREVAEQESESDPSTTNNIDNENTTETKSEDRVQTQEEIDEQSDFQSMVDPETETEQDIDSAPVKTRNVVDTENNEQSLELNEVSDNLSFTESKDKKSRVKGKNSIVQQAKNAALAVAKFFPNLKIIVHRDQESYVKLDKSNDRGFYNPTDNTIHINLSNANGRTVAHEIFHGVVVGKLGADTMAVTKKMVQALVRSRSIPKGVRAELKKFVKNYSSEVQNEERLAEIFGMIADNYTKFDAPTKSRIRLWIESIAKRLGIEIGQSSSEVIELLNTLAGKVQTGETITESDLSVLTKFNTKQEQGTEGQVGTDLNVKKSKGVNAPPISEDNRPFTKHIKDKSLADFAGRNFVTNMYDFTMSGVTNLGKGLSTTLFGGKNYVADMMEKAGKNLGDVSNLAAFNSESQAASFIRNVLQGQANLFIPHRGTNDNSWQFQQAIFESLVNVAIDNKILTEQEMKDSFNEVLTNEVGNKAFNQFKSKLDKNITNFNDLSIQEIVESLNIENNFSPNLRKALNDKLAANKKYQTSLGVKNKTDFALKLEDPSNKGSRAFDLISITEFDPNSMVISKPNPGDIDYHPSFAYTIKAKIDGIYQPTKFYQSTEVTKSYTKYNKGQNPATSVKKLVGSQKFKQSNVSSSAGAIPKVGTISVRKQKSAKNLGSNYNMNFKGFMPSNIYNIQSLKKAAAELGLTVHAAYIREGFRKGELVGHYFKRNNRFFNPMQGVRKQLNINEVGQSGKNIIEIVSLGIKNNIKIQTIVNYLKDQGFKMSEINPVIKVSGYTLENMPKSFGNVQGGVMNGLKLFDKVVAFRNKLMNNNLTPVGRKISKLIQKIDDLKADLDQPTLFKNKSRVKKIENDIKKIQKQINTIQEKARKDNKKLYNHTQSEIDEMTVDFLESQPEYVNESFEGGLSTQQAQMISQMKTTFSGNALMDVGGRIKRAKAILRQRVKGRKELEKIKKDLRNFIRQSLPSYVFERSEVIKLMNSITNVDLSNIENKKAEVIEFVNKKTNAALKRKIEKVLNGKYDDLQSNRKKSYKVDDDTRIRLKNIREMLSSINVNDIKNVEVKIQEMLKTISDLESQTDLTPENRNDIADLNLVIDYLGAQLSSEIDTSQTESLSDVLNDLNSLVETGKTVLQQGLFAKHLQYVSEFEALYYDMTGLRIKTYIENPEFNDLSPESNKNRRLIKNPEAEDALRNQRLISEQRKNKIKNRAIKAVANLATASRNFVFRNSDLSTWMAIIGKMPGEILGNETQKITSVKINAGTREYKARKMATTIAINTKLEEVYGSKWKQRSQEDSSLAPTGIILHTGVELPDMSQNQMMYLVAQYKDPANQLSFQTKYGKDYKRIMSEMEAKLNDEVKELSRWQVEEFFPSLYQDYNEAYKKIYRTSMPWNEYYAGRIYREGRDTQTDIMNLLGTEKNAFSQFASPASTKVRIKNKTAIADMDQMATLLSYVNDMNYFASMAEPINDLNKLFKNEDIKKNIKFNFGNAPYDSIMDMITKLANRGVSNDLSMEWVNNITSAFVIGKLAINPTIFIKQLTSAPAYSNFIGIRNWSKAAATNITDFKSTWKEISKNSVYIQDRYGESILRTLESYSNSAVQSVVPVGFKENTISFLMYLVKQGDKGAILLGGVPNYIYYKNKFKAENPRATEQEAIDHAVVLFERDTKMTQQSSDLQDKDEFQTGAWYARGLNMFQTSIKQYFRQELVAALNIYRKVTSKNKEGKGTLWEASRQLIIYHSLLPIAFQYIAAGLPGILAPWDDEDGEDLMRAAVIGNLNAMFILGEIVTYYGDKWTGKPWTGQSSGGIPVLEVTAKFFQELQKADKYNISEFDKNGKRRKPEAVAKSIQASQDMKKKAIFNLVNSLGLPIRQIDRLIENTDKILSGELSPEEFILYALQYSEYVVESAEERKKKNTKEKAKDKLSVEEMRRFDPEAYQRYRQEQDAIKNSPWYREQQRLKKLEKQRRQQYLNEKYNN